MSINRSLILMLLALSANGVSAESTGVEGELSPEELDAAFTEEDAAREAARWSPVIIDRSNTDPLGRMTQSADLVIEAAVKSQEYVYGQDDQPYTHTTFAISQVLQGSYSEGEITVVQEGGPEKNDPDIVNIVSETQYFSVGEDEILFLNLDSVHSLPTQKVKIAKRFRLFGGQVYDENGRGIQLISVDNGKGHRLGLSKNRNAAPRFQKFQIGKHTFTKQFAQDDDYPDSGGEDEGVGRNENPEQGSGADMRNFRAAIASKRGA